MLLYYKRQFVGQFETYRNQDKLIEKQELLGPAKPFAEYLSLYTNLEFPNLLSQFDVEQQNYFEELLKLVTLSHRYNKGDELLANPVIPFEQIRDIAYKFSERAKDRFFEQPLLAFMFAWFSVSASGKNFLS